MKGIPRIDARPARLSFSIPKCVHNRVFKECSVYTGMVTPPLCSSVTVQKRTEQGTLGMGALAASEMPLYVAV